MPLPIMNTIRSPIKVLTLYRYNVFRVRLALTWVEKSGSVR